MNESGLTVDVTKIDADQGFFDEFERPTKEQWKAEATAALKGAPFDKVMYTKTYENLTIEPIYCAEDIEGLPHLASRPGFAPFVRSTKASGYLGEPRSSAISFAAISGGNRLHAEVPGQA